MSELEMLSAALRQAAVNLTAAASRVGRVLESVADSLEKSAPATSPSPRPRKKAAAPAARTRTSRSSAPRTQRSRGRRPSG